MEETAMSDRPRRAAVSAAETAYAILRRRIATGRIPANTLLSENEIALELEISRTPVREAFVRLESDGWLKLFPKRGALVVPIEPGEAEAIVEARLLIEGHAIETLPEKLQQTLARTLTEFISRQQSAIENEDFETAAEIDAAFHQEIVDAADNHVISDLYHHLEVRQLRMTEAVLTKDIATAASVLRGHTRIAKALAAGDAPAALRALRRHLTQTHLH